MYKTRNKNKYDIQLQTITKKYKLSALDGHKHNAVGLNTTSGGKTTMTAGTVKHKKQTTKMSCDEYKY